MSVADGVDPAYNEDEDGYDFTLLSYGNGPGYKKALRKENITDGSFSK